MTAALRDSRWPRVIVSNGFNKFFLSVAAAHAAADGMLASFLTGAYPTAPVRRAVDWTGTADHPKCGRLLRRGDPRIPAERIRAFPVSEAISILAWWMERSGVAFADRVNVASFEAYGRAAAKAVLETGGQARIYHYRAGFGQSSVPVAKRMGMVALCDHSIAHPALVEYLVRNEGRFPPKGEVPRMSRFWTCIARDIGQADHVVVNSAFVRNTMLSQGWAEDRVHTVYLSVEDQYFTTLPARSPARGPDLRIAFAGLVERRKGVDVLFAALESLGDVAWRLDLVGPIPAEIAGRYATFLRDPRVTCHGILPRDRLAALLTEVEVFAFPSLCEGSARVIFEALAAGCFVITTPNSGSIVEDGIHGIVVPPGDPEALAAAIRKAADDRDAVATIGADNAALVGRRYREPDYWRNVRDLYCRIA